MRTFFHPDYTVGPGIAPGRRLAAFADYTAGGEFRPALKILFSLPTAYHGQPFLSRGTGCGKMRMDKMPQDAASVAVVPAVVLGTVPDVTLGVVSPAEGILKGRI